MMRNDGPVSDPTSTLRSLIGARRIEKWTVPLVGESDKNPGEKTVGGTGVLLRARDRLFLITAGHVSDYATLGSRVYIGTRLKPGHIPILSAPVVMSSKTEDRCHREDDHFDVAVFQLSEHLARDLTQERECVRLPDVSAHEHFQVGSPYVVAGYPEAWCVSKGHGDQVNMAGLMLFTRVAEMARADVPPWLNPSVHVVLDYCEGADMDTGLRVELPHPVGISGCGVWRLSGDWASQGPIAYPRTCALVGIETALWKKRYLIATRISYVLEMIDEIASRPSSGE